MEGRFGYRGVVGGRKGAGTCPEEEEAWSQAAAAEAVAAVGEVDHGRHIASHRHRDKHRAHGPEPGCAGEGRLHALGRKLELGRRRA